MLLVLTLLATSALQAPASETLSYDAKRRPMVAVRIDDYGPYPMVLDTAAETSLIAGPLADELGLPVVPGDIGISGATVSSRTTLRGVDRLSSSLFDERTLALPTMPNPAVTTARGIIGMDLFAGRKLVIDRTEGRVSVEASGAPAPGFVAIKGKAQGGLLVVPITIDSKPVLALVDSGAEGTIADPSLLAALGWQDGDARVKSFGTMRGAGGASLSVRAATVGAVRIGPVNFRDVPIVIADKPAFALPGNTMPVIVLGSNLLNLLTAYAVDFPRAELQVQVPARPK